MEEHISHGVIKVIEIVGVSQESFDDAVSQGLRQAAASVRDIT